MKIVMCISGQKVASNILSALKQSHYRVTQLASEGGFMKRGNVTYLIGVEEDNVPDVLRIIKDIGVKPEVPSSADRALAIVLDAEAGATFMSSDEESP